MLLRNIKYLITQDDARRVLERVDVHIEGDRIVRIGKRLRAQGTVIDCTDRIVLPGLINAHTHLGMHGLRGLMDDAELHAWLPRMFAEERRMTPAAIRAASLAGMREALRSGTTAVADMYFHPRHVGDAAARAGIRALIGQTYLRGHPLATQAMELPPRTGVVTYAFAPHAIYTTNATLLRKIRAAATRAQARIMIHLSETRAERAACKAKTGLLPAEFLAKIGLLGPDVLLVHCVWLTKGELDCIARSGASIVHCPQSNMKLAGGGVMPLREMRERGIRVCLGTDSVVSNNSLDMFREMHVAALLHKHHYWDPTAAPAQEVLDMATVHAADALGIDAGRITEGRCADIITLDARADHLQPLLASRIISHIVYAADGADVRDVIVDGKVRVRDGRVR